MSIKESTHLLIGIVEDMIEIGFFTTVAMKMVVCVSTLGWLWVSSMPQKLVRFFIGGLSP